MTLVTPEQMAHIIQVIGHDATIRVGLEAAALYLKGRVSEYPPEASKELRRQGFKTAKSRRYFFYALSRGLIDVPYRRGISEGSQTMNKRWSVSVSALHARIGNTASYAPIVIGNRSQSRYMRRLGWKPIDEAAQERASETAAQFVHGMHQRVRAIT